MDKIQEEMQVLKAERKAIDKEVKMFSFLFFGGGLVNQGSNGQG